MIASGGCVKIRLENVSNRRAELLSNPRAAIGRAIVYQNDFVRPVSLHQDALNCLLQVTLAVINGNNDTYPRVRHLVRVLRNFIPLDQLLERYASQTTG